jgi:hypothetical protein
MNMKGLPLIFIEMSSDPTEMQMEDAGDEPMPRTANLS